MVKQIVWPSRGVVSFRILLLLCALLLAAVSVRAQETPAAGDDLSVEQARLADRFDRLEQVVGRLAELSASTDPRRARLLREAIARSREQDLNLRFESIVKLLEDERLSAAANNQTELHKELDSLLSLLLKADRDEQIASERERIRKYLKEVGRLIRMQKGVRARTEGGDETGRLAKDQQQVADDTGKLGGTIKENEGEQPADDKQGDDEKSADKETESNDSEKPKSDKEKSDKESKDGEQSKPGDASKPGESSEGEKADSAEGQPSESKPSDSKPSEGQPADGKPSPSQGAPQDGGQQSGGQQSDSDEQQQQPTDRATERLRSAQQKMEDAKKKLDEAERDGATQKQREALKELELAKAELERVLRQLREEEMERTLTQLAARFRKMLEAQVVVYEGTQRLDRVPQSSRDHDDEIEAAKLSRQEALIVREADKAMLLLREEGSSVAFPEAVEQMRDDMQQVAERLAALKVDKLTQGLEEDIIAALEETIAALEKELKDLEKKRGRPGQPPPAGQQAEPPLVNKLAELKMIRSLQMRIYRRTQRYGEMMAGDQAETPDLLEALEELAQRQQRVYQATFDLNEGSND